MAPPPPQSFGESARRAFAQTRETLRAQDRYARIQMALVAGWIVVSIATVGAVAFGGPSTGNHLGADVRAELAIGGPVLLVTNASSSPWTDVTYTLNGRYLYRQATLAPGDHLTVAVGRFRNGGSAGKRAPRDLEPRLLEIACEEGSAALPLAPLVKSR